MNARQKIREYLFGTLMPTDRSAWPADDVDLFESGMDSLRVMQLLVFVEEKLGVLLPDHEVTPERIATVDALVAWIEEKRG